MRIVKNWKSETGNTEYEIGFARRHGNNDDPKRKYYFWSCSTDQYEIGGDLLIWTDPNGKKWINDFDGAFDLPKGIKKHLRSKGVEVDF